MKNQEIEEKARELADMVGSVAVDENLPLEVIEMTADILKEDCEQIRQAAVDIAEEERAIRLEYSTDTTKGGQTKILKQIAIKFVTDAEGECGAGTGIIKLSEVVAKMYAYLPSVVRILFTEKQLVQIAESVLAEAKKKWEANENLTTYIENKQQTTPAVVPLAENTK